MIAGTKDNSILDAPSQRVNLLQAKISYRLKSPTAGTEDPDPGMAYHGLGRDILSTSTKLRSLQLKDNDMASV